MNRCSGRSRERGVILVVVLWMTTLLSIMAASYVFTVRTGMALATAQVELAKARAAAQAGVAYAVMNLLSPKALQEWPLNGSPREWRFGPARVMIGITGANGKVDLNRANRELLGGLLESAGVEGEDLDALLDAIEDWRDPNDLVGLNGAEADEYRAAGRPFGPKDANFESVEELQQVLGMTPEVYRRIATELTVFSRQPGVDPTLASDALLRAIPGLDELVVEDYIEARAQSIAEGLPLSDAVLLGSNPHLSQGRTLAYHITVEASLDAGPKAVIQAVVVPRPRGEMLYQQHAWREGK